MVTIILVINIYAVFMFKDLKKDIGFIKSDVADIFYKVMQ